MRNSQFIVHNFTTRKALLRIVHCALLIALVACGSSSPQPTSTESSIVALWPSSDTVRTDTMHLGRVKEGEIISSNFTVRNISTSPLVIIDVKVACGCAKATFDTSPVMPGESRRIDFTFNSSGRRGTQIKYFDLQSADNQNLKIFFDAEVI